MEYFIFNNLHSYKDLKLTLAEYPTLPIPQKIYEDVEIEGKSGTVTIDKSKYGNMEISLNIQLMEDGRGALYNLLNNLMNFEDNRLIFSDNFITCYKVKRWVVDGLTRELMLFKAGTITAILEPFMYPVEEYPVEVKNNSNFIYEGLTTEPLITLDLGATTQNIQFIFNGETLQFMDVTGVITINSELRTITDATGKSILGKTIGSFPIITTGTNTISWIGNIKSVKIDVRGRYLL